MALKNYQNNQAELPLAQRSAVEEGAFEGLSVACSELIQIIIRWFLGLFSRGESKRGDSMGFSRPRGDLRSDFELNTRVINKLGVARYNKSVDKASATHRK
jgi:hypothetical protein